MANINKIHSTNMSLNDRFTAIASSKSASLRSIGSSSQDAVATVANRNLLRQLVRKEKMRAALKLKRKSLRTVGGAGNYTRANLRANNGIALKRGSVKALRVAANGRPIKTNSLSRVATMKADLVSVRNRGRTLRRSNSVTSLSNRLGGTRRPLPGGAAQRVAQRNLLRRAGSVQRGRSRSRSRARMPLAANNAPRGRSQSRGRVVGVEAPNMRRGRSRSRSRTRAVPIQARLGVRPGQKKATATVPSNRGRGRSVSKRRQPSLSRRGVAQGRVQKLRTTTAAMRTRGGVAGAVGNLGGRVGRTRGRTAAGVARGRSQSNNGGQARVYGAQRQQQQKWATRSSDGQVSGRRGRREQRGGIAQRKGNQVTNGKRQQEQQPQRRGRSRSRGRGGRVGRNQGSNPRNQTVNKEELDKELDQYMLTTKTENNIDYLLQN